MMKNFRNDIDSVALKDCPRCHGTGEPHHTDHPRVKKCMCILHYYVCPTIQSAGTEKLHRGLEKCDCAIKYYQELYESF